MRQKLLFPNSSYFSLPLPEAYFIMFDSIQIFADWVTFSLLGLGTESHFATALNFFIYDSLKVSILLFVIVFLMGIVNEYVPVERLRKTLTQRNWFGFEYLLASIFGALTPFCSCSSVPLFIGFVRGGIPLGVTLTFLITSPLVNEVALALFLGLFGWKVTLIYGLSGIFIGSLVGIILGKLNLEPLLSEWTRNMMSNATTSQENEIDRRSFTQRLPNIFREATSIVRAVFIYVLIGIGIGAGMHGYVPDQFFVQYLGTQAWWTVPLAVILAVPIYANAAAIVPVGGIFVVKGVPLGTALAFMMATVGLSLPEATLLKKGMTTPLILIFFGVVTTSILLLGLVFNQIL